MELNKFVQNLHRKDSIGGMEFTAGYGELMPVGVLISFTALRSGIVIDVRTGSHTEYLISMYSAQLTL